MQFTITKTDKRSSARSGVLTTSHGTIHTPAFMPVGTYGAVKTLTPNEIRQTGSEIILGNTYHLYLRPGTAIIEQAAGLHAFNGWSGPILTDSGGFQVFSLARLNTIDDDGVTFQSHLDGASHRLTPEISMAIQRSLGSDIIMAFDECPPGQADVEVVSAAVRRTAKWIKRCFTYLQTNDPLYASDQTLFPIIQGGIFPELRAQSLDTLLPYATCGMAIGGLAVGEEKSAMFDILEFLDDRIPREHPRYLMGVGKPTDIIRAVRSGVDMFDCVLPTRNARNGQVLTSRGKINLRNAKWKNDFSPVDPDCSCLLCQDFTKAYVSHLFRVNEILGLRLATLHNITFYQGMMRTIREKIAAGTFLDWAEAALLNWGDM